ncbi:MAG: hypothetical protein JNL32_10610, partial [Candidatus Kapabacteria bacterium]|nr:hypothetical protein [Candidatus Kapabacteria bacterium]
TRRDALGRNLGIATNYVYSASVGAGYDIGGASFGVAGKYVANNVGALGLSGSGFAFDAGARLPFANMFTFGASVQNIGFMQWNNASRTSESLPFMIRAGLSTEVPFENTSYESRTAAIGEVETVYQPPVHYLLVSLDGVFVRGNNNPTVMLGAEYSPTELFQVRGGLALLGDTFGSFSIFPMSVFSGGASYRIAANELPFTMQLDYAAMNDMIIPGGLSHHFSVFIEL